MPITTLDKVNQILGYTTGDDTTRDALITALIPMVQDNIIRYTRNDFLNKNVQIDGQFAFVKGDPDTITHSDSEFVENDFIAGDYRVRFSKNNNGIITVASVTADTLTLSTSNTIVNESADNEIIITQIKWPVGIELPVAHLIGASLTPKGTNVKSESLPGGYSVTYLSNSELYDQFKVFK